MNQKVLLGISLIFILILCGQLQGNTGVRYDAVDQVLYVNSKNGNLKSFLSTEYGFGMIEMKDGEVVLDVRYGEISV